MRLITSTLALFLSAIVANAALAHDSHGLSARHNRLSHRDTNLDLEARAPAARRCPNRTFKSTLPSVSASSNNLVASKKAPASSSASPKPSSSAKKAVSTPAVTFSSGVINVPYTCGGSRATKQITAVSGPNGHIDWLNCGFEGSGWNPPNVKVSDLVIQSLSSALQNPNTPFKACSKYIPIFERYGQQYGIPPIILASFSMQESGCNPNTVGGGGEQGMMQITSEKCVGAPGGNCKDPDFNIHTATKFFAATLAANGGNIIRSVGAYNGWSLGLTKEKAFAARWSSCCRCQNNGDYLHQFFNGWIQNINAYGPLPLGKYFNLNVC